MEVVNDSTTFKRDRDRSRSPLRQERSRSGSHDRSRPRRSAGSRGTIADRRVIVTNVDYEATWQEIKDFIKEIVGDVKFVELAMNPDNRTNKGFGVIEFGSVEDVDDCFEKVHRIDYKGRKLVIKEYKEDLYRRLTAQAGGSPGGNLAGSGRNGRMDRMMGGGDRGSGGMGMGGQNMDTYNIPIPVLKHLGIDPPLSNRVFVANLDFHITAKRLKDVFRLAGYVEEIDMKLDKDGNFRGFALVEYESPVDAVNAVGMMNGQVLNDRPLAVRLDKYNDSDVMKRDKNRMPVGLKGIGMNLLQMSNALGCGVMSGGGMGAGGMMPTIQQDPNMGMMSNMIQQAQANMGGGGGNLMGAGLANLQPNMASALSAQTPNMNSILGNAATAVSNLLGSGLIPGGGMNQSQNSGMGMPNQQQQQSMSMHNTSGGGSGIDMGVANNQYTSASSGGGLGQYSIAQQAQQHLQNMGISNSQMRGGGDDGGGGRDDRGSRRSDGGGGGMQRDFAVVVRNLPSNVAWQNVKDRFADIGDVRYCEMKTRGVAIVKFLHMQDAVRAINIMNGNDWGGRTIRVEMDQRS